MRFQFGMWEKITAAVLALLLVLCIVVGIFLDERMQRGNEPLSDAANPLGMVLIDIADDGAAASYHVEEMGVYVLAVDEKSPAYLAGLRSGDRLISINGCKIHNTGELEKAQRGFPPSGMLRVEFLPHSQQRVLTTNLLWSGENALQ